MFYKFPCHPCTGAVLIFSVSFQFSICAAKASTTLTFSCKGDNAVLLFVHLDFFSLTEWYLVPSKAYRFFT